MPPPSLSTTTIVRSAPRRLEPEQAVAVVEQGDIADQQRRRGGRAPAPRRRRWTRPRRCRWRPGWPGGAARPAAPSTTPRRAPAWTTTPPTSRRPAAPRRAREPHRVRSDVGHRPAPTRWRAAPVPRPNANVPPKVSEPRPRAAWPGPGRAPTDPPPGAARPCPPGPPRPPTPSPAPGPPPRPPAIGPASSRPVGDRGGAPRSGVWSAAKPGWRRRSSKVATVWGRGRRQPDRGSASTGQPAAAARSCTAPGSPAPAPATIRPRG